MSGPLSKWNKLDKRLFSLCAAVQKGRRPGPGAVVGFLLAVVVLRAPTMVVPPVPGLAALRPLGGPCTSTLPARGPPPAPAAPTAGPASSWPLLPPSTGPTSPLLYRLPPSTLCSTPSSVRPHPRFPGDMQRGWSSHTVHSPQRGITVRFRCDVFLNNDSAWLGGWVPLTQRKQAWPSGWEKQKELRDQGSGSKGQRGGVRPLRNFHSL